MVTCLHQQPGANAKWGNSMEEMGPTEETAAKLKADKHQGDYLRWLFMMGKIDFPHWDAAVDIRDAYSYKFAACGVRQSIYGEVNTAVGYKWLSDSHDPVCVKRYDTWCDRMDRRKMARDPVIDVIINGRDGVKPEDLAEALDLYPHIPY